MTLSRRRVLQVAAGVAALPVVLRRASAQTYPSRPVTIIVGFAPGGAPDVLARLLALSLQEQLGQTFIVENRQGGSGNIATEAVARAAPDGHTLLLCISGNAINATLYDNLKFDFVHDLAPVAGVARGPNVMIVNPNVPAKTVPEFIAYAKANPGKINFGSGGAGTSVHMSGELFKLMSQIDMQHVPYRGESAALTDIIGGQLQVMFPTSLGSIPHIKSGAVRALAVTTPTRSEALPDLPAVAEFLPGYDASGWQGMSAPKGTPGEIVEKLNVAINKALGDPKIKARISDLGSTTMVMSPTEFGKFIADEVAKWAKVIRAANVKPG